MEQTLPSRQSDKLEDRDITLVLEQLQENGFSSFFDHPDCPFSSIQEVDEALKELEKEFLKICVEQEAKSSQLIKKSKLSVAACSVPSNLKFKPKTKKNNDLKKENNHRFGARERLEKRDALFKKPDTPKFGLPTTSRSASFNPLTERSKVHPECGDSKDVCGIDSCGNKYTLKIEVFATVKLEPEERNEAGKNVKPGSKIILSASKHKRNDLTGLNSLVVPSKDQPESCAPLVLNYRSSVSKPCPSYMYPSACHLKKTLLPQKRKLDALARGNQIEDDRIEAKAVNTTTPSLTKINEVSRKMLEKVSAEEINAKGDMERPIVLRNGQTELQQDVQFEAEIESNYNLEKNDVINYSAEERDDDDPDLTKHKSPSNHCMEVQTSTQDISVYYSTPLDNCNMTEDVLENPEPLKTFDQQQQTSFINTVPVSTEDEDVNRDIAIPEPTTPKFEMIDKEVGTSLYLLFDQNLINELKGLEEMISSNIINEDNYEEIILSDVDNEEIINLSNMHASLDKRNSDVTDVGNNLEFNIGEKELDVASKDIKDRISLVDVGIGTDTADLFPFADGQQDNLVAFVEGQEASNPDLNGFMKFDDKEWSDSSSNETVIVMDVESNLENKEKVGNKEEGKSLVEDDFAGEAGDVGSEPNSVVDVSQALTDESSADLTSPKNNSVDLTDKAVGSSCEVLWSADKSNLVDREVDSMSNEFVNGKEPVEIKSSDSSQESAILAFKKIELIDKEVGMSKETFSTLIRAQKTVNNDGRATSIDSFFMELKTCTVDKDMGPEIKCQPVREKEMIDKEIETVVESKSMSTNMDETSKKESSVKEIITCVSKQSGGSKSKNDELCVEKENSSDTKFAKWSKSKVPMGQKLFKKPDSKSVESDKYMKILKERREKRKSEEGSVKSRESATKRDKGKHEDDKEHSASSTSSSDHLTKIDTYRWKEISEYETKFVKGVFSRHSNTPATKNKIALRRRAFSNLDQKIIATKLAKSRKMIGSLKSAKKSSWERSKSHSGVKLSRKHASKEHSTGEYPLSESTVINMGE